jgi:hypothetical protein
MLDIWIPLGIERFHSTLRRLLMFPSRLVLALLFAFIPGLASAQQSTSPPATPQRDPQAVSAAQRAIALMGGSAPADSTMSGTVNITAGSATQQGTIQILTLGQDQTSEQVTTADSDKKLIYSRTQSAERNAGVLKIQPLELTATSQSTVFPLPLLANILGNQDFALRYVGLETIDGTNYHHIQTWNTFSSNPEEYSLAEFTVRNFWFDAGSGLPWKTSFNVRAAHGDVPSLAVSVVYSDYEKVSGVLYPFHIEKSLNSTPWMSIDIETVQINTGLTDANFSTCGDAQ